MARIRDFGINPGKMPTGAANSITDIPGVTVGHITVTGSGIATGVTAVIPQPGNLFESKLTAAVEVINGFGKSVGLVQVAEQGTLETPILLTNTFGVGTCSNALIRHAVAQSPDIGRGTSTVNPVVCECNDGILSDIQTMAVSEADALRAIAGAGTASRRVGLASGPHFLGVLVLANFGRAGDLVLPDGRRPDPRGLTEAEKGSVIVVIATDLPLDHRQLARVCRRAGAGLARLGAFYGNGSGDIVLGFTTRNRVPHRPDSDVAGFERLADTKIDLAFQAACEATEEAVLNALCQATAVEGRDGASRPLLSEWLRSA